MNPLAPQAQRTRKALITRAGVERVILMAVVAGSLWAIYWSIGRLRTLQSHSSRLNQQVASLTADIDLMKARWPGARQDAIDRRYAQVTNTLFAGEGSVQDWAESLQKDSVPLALTTQFRVGSLQSSTNGARVLTRVRASLETQASATATSTRSVFQRITDWIQLVSNQPRRVDLLELTITGGLGSAGSASATVELWSDDHAATNTAPEGVTSQSPTEPTAPALTSLEAPADSPSTTPEP